jgi:hypothetical protein
MMDIVEDVSAIGQVNFEKHPKVLRVSQCRYSAARRRFASVSKELAKSRASRAVLPTASLGLTAQSLIELARQNFARCGCAV